MQKITHINLAKGFRGGERQTQLLIEELSRRGYEQELVLRKDSLLKDRLNGIKNLKIFTIKKPYIFYLKILKNSKIIHAHETKAAQFALFANLFYKIPYIVTRRVAFRIKDNYFNRAIYQNAKYVVVLSTAIKDELKRVAFNSNIKIIPSSYSDFTIDKQFVKSIKNRYRGRFLIGNISALDGAKGHKEMIESMRKLSKTYPDIHLIFLGSGKYEGLFKEKAKDLNNITFQGFVDNVGDYISAFDLFIFPSLNEGLGSILLDVMRLRVPIIATKVGGILDIVKDNETGLLIKPNSSEELYNSIEKMYLDHKLRDRLRDNAYKNIENFSFSKMCDRYEEIYK